MNEDCLKLTTYFGERDRSAGGCWPTSCWTSTASIALQASVLLRGSEGFGRLHHRHTDRLLSLSEDLPVVSIAVDTRERGSSRCSSGSWRSSAAASSRSSGRAC